MNYIHSRLIRRVVLWSTKVVPRGGLAGSTAGEETCLTGLFCKIMECLSGTLMWGWSYQHSVLRAISHSEERH